MYTPENTMSAAPDTMTRNVVAMAQNIATMRANLLNHLLDGQRNIDGDCGYPGHITAQQYRALYDREGIAERVVNVYPQESWAMEPTIYETEDPEETEFEKAWKELDRRHNCLHYLQRVDELSGIGCYGVLLLGLDDGQPLHDPLFELDQHGDPTPTTPHPPLYLRAFDESMVNVSQFDSDVHSPRYGEPVLYSIQFYDPTAAETGATTTPDQTTKSVHWTRLIHVADNRKNSEVYGTPRMRPVYNRLYDLRKLLGGSAEMFWKGAFPGYSFEVNPEIVDPQLDREAVRQEMEALQNGLQRYMAHVGITAKSLAPQVSDPSAHVQVQLQAIAITLGVPLRTFMGSEQAQLAASQDSRAWNRRLERRQHKYLTPMVLRPLVDRLLVLGVLPPVDEYFVDWPDLNSPTDMDKAEVAAKRTEALAKYVGGGVDTLIPPMEYLMMFMGLTQEEAEQVQAAAIKHITGANPDADVPIVQGRNPTPAALEPGAEQGTGPDDPGTDDEDPEEGEGGATPPARK